jgi:hypothetical protein
MALLPSSLEGFVPVKILLNILVPAKLKRLAVQPVTKILLRIYIKTRFCSSWRPLFKQQHCIPERLQRQNFVLFIELFMAFLPSYFQ